MMSEHTWPREWWRPEAPATAAAVAAPPGRIVAGNTAAFAALDRLHDHPAGIAAGLVPGDQEPAHRARRRHGGDRGALCGPHVRPGPRLAGAARDGHRAGPGVVGGDHDSAVDLGGRQLGAVDRSPGEGGDLLLADRHRWSPRGAVSMRFTWVLALCSIPLAVTALANYRSGVFITHASSSVQRIAGYVGGAGLAGNPNDLALMLNLLMPLTGALFVISKQPWLRLIALGALMLSVAAVIATFSRAGFITLAVIGVAAFAAMLRRGALGAAVVMVFLVLGAFVLTPEKYFNRLATITNIEADTTGSAQGRWDDYFVSLEYIRTHPLTGAGLGQDLLALNETRGRSTWRSVHNAFLQAAVDLGLPGLALLLALLLASFANARRVRRQAARQRGSSRSRVCWPAVSTSRCSPFRWPPSSTRSPTSSTSSAWRGWRSLSSTRIAPRSSPGSDSRRERHPADQRRAHASLRRHRNAIHDAGARARSRPIRCAVRLPAAAGTVCRRAVTARHAAA